MLALGMGASSPAGLPLAVMAEQRTQRAAGANA